MQAPLLSRSCPGFPARTGSAPPRTRSKNPLLGLLGPGAGGEGSFKERRGWVGAGRRRVRWRPATLLGGLRPPPPPKWQQLRTLGTPLLDTEEVLLEAP